MSEENISITATNSISDYSKNYPAGFDHNPGETVYLLTDTDIIIPSKIIECHDVYDAGDRSVWHYRYLESQYDYVSVSTDEKDEDGWNKYERKDISFLNGLRKCNQFIWIDEPIGHGVTLDDPYDGVFTSLKKAREHAKVTKPKHLKRRLNDYRNSVHKFIKWTWDNSGDTEKHPGFDPLPMKKVYVRRG